MTFPDPRVIPGSGVPEVEQEQRHDHVFGVRCRPDCPRWMNPVPQPGWETPQDWYFTFGSDHTHPDTGQRLGRNYVQIYGTCDDTRDAMFAVFGNRWSHQYSSSDKARSIDEYNLTEVPMPGKAQTHGLDDGGRTQCGQPGESLDVTEFPALVSCEACLLTMAPPAKVWPEEAAFWTEDADGDPVLPVGEVEERTEEDCPDLGIGDHDCITHAEPEVQQLAQALRSFGDRIAQAIGDPGSIVGRSDGKETVTRWGTRAVLQVLTESNVGPPSAEGFSGGTAALRADVVTQVLEEVANARRLAHTYGLASESYAAGADDVERFAALRAITAAKANLTASFDRIASAVKGEQRPAYEDGMFYLHQDQINALHALLALVHYDDLAESWLKMLPAELRPQGRGEQQ